MNYDNLHTTAEIMKAFEECHDDAGKEIDLFEALAWRDDPPIDAFEVIMEEIKLETVLILAIQSVGWVKNQEILENSRQSKKLLKNLCNLAGSGATDLIRWSATKSIINIGFDFISVSRYLAMKPQQIIDDIDRSLLSPNVPDEKKMSFWIYGDIEKLYTSKEATFLDVSSVFKKKGIRVIRETNFYLSLSYKNLIDENIYFTTISQEISQLRLMGNESSYLISSYAEILISNQIFCLNSKNQRIRKASEMFLCSYVPSDNLLISPKILNALNHLRASKKAIRISEENINEIELRISEAEKRLCEVDKGIYRTENEINTFDKDVLKIKNGIKKLENGINENDQKIEQLNKKLDK